MCSTMRRTPGLRRRSPQSPARREPAKRSTSWKSPTSPASRPDWHLTLLQTENVRSESFRGRASMLSNAITNWLIQPLRMPGALVSSSGWVRLGASACPTRLYTRRMMRFLRGLEMPNYITLGNWTEQGIKTVKESPKRADAVSALANKLGAKMQIFYTMGRYDSVALTEAPN